MPLLKTINEKFSDLKFILENQDRQTIKMNAQGGNSILFVYPPKEEQKYLQKMGQFYPDAYFINIAELFAEFIDKNGPDDFFDAFEEYASEPEKLFKSEFAQDDFFSMVLNEIKIADEQNKMPVLIRTGAFYGTGIENINFMDSDIVHSLHFPLIIMYPATIGADGKLKFLNHKLASDYRAIVI